MSSNIFRHSKLTAGWKTGKAAETSTHHDLQHSRVTNESKTRLLPATDWLVIVDEISQGREGERPNPATDHLDQNEHVVCKSHTGLHLE